MNPQQLSTGFKAQFRTRYDKVLWSVRIELAILHADASTERSEASLLPRSTRLLSA